MNIELHDSTTRIFPDARFFPAGFCTFDIRHSIFDIRYFQAYIDIQDSEGDS
jgi:hypothetical protein